MGGEPKFVLMLDGVDEERLARDPSYLRSLCQKEVDRFVDYVRQADPQFQDGLAKFERFAIEGYLYQKAKGHIDALRSQGLQRPEGQDGKTTGR